MSAEDDQHGAVGASMGGGGAAAQPAGSNPSVPAGLHQPSLTNGIIDLDSDAGSP